MSVSSFGVRVSFCILYVYINKKHNSLRIYTLFFYPSYLFKFVSKLVRSHFVFIIIFATVHCAVAIWHRSIKKKLGLDVPRGAQPNCDSQATNLSTMRRSTHFPFVVDVKRFLVVNSLEELNKKLDRYYMVLILRCLHSLNNMLAWGIRWSRVHNIWLHMSNTRGHIDEVERNHLRGERKSIKKSNDRSGWWWQIKMRTHGNFGDRGWKTPVNSGFTQKDLILTLNSKYHIKINID